MKIRLKNRIVMHKTPEAESRCFYAKWQIEDLGTICVGTPILGASAALTEPVKFAKFDIEKRYGKSE